MILYKNRGIGVILIIFSTFALLRNVRKLILNFNYLFMAKIRFSALEELANRKPVELSERHRVSEIFGCDVLTIEKMRHYLSIEGLQKAGKNHV